MTHGASLAVAHDSHSVLNMLLSLQVPDVC